MRLNPRIFGAFLVGAGLITFAYFGAQNQAKQAIDTSSESGFGVAPTRTYIAITDTDDNGVPDWTEELLQAEPIMIMQNASTTPDYVPTDTLTSRLAVDIFTGTARGEMAGVLSPPKETLLANLGKELDQAKKDPEYTEKELTISNNTSKTALRTYSNQIAELVVRDMIPPGTRSEIEIVGEAVQKNNHEMLAELDPIIRAYETARDAMLLITVPENMTVEHLELLNTYNALLIDLKGMRAAFDDPIYAMLRIEQYFEHTADIKPNLTQLYRSLYLAGVRWTEADISSQVVTIQ